MPIHAKQVSVLLHAIDVGVAPSDLISPNDATRALCFADILGFIDAHYHYHPVTFTNGTVHNAVGTNEGSAKVFGFAKLHDLSQSDTLKLFCEHYQAVIDNPTGIDHPNIRNFRFWGWRAFAMPHNPLTPKN